MRPTVFLILLSWVSCAYAQLTVADRYAPYQPIIAGCNCIVPENGSVQFMWQVDSLSKAMPSDDNLRLYIWAPPGSHNVEAVVAVTVFKDVQVWVPDPMHPNDITKAVLSTIKTLVSFDVQRYSKSYMVGPGPAPGPGPPPGPGPDPGPSPGPTPTDDFAKQAFAWMKAVPTTAYSKDKANAIADNYSAVAAQAVATSGWDLTAFVNQTKQLNQKKLTTDDIAAWATPFFNPLANYQSKVFAERNLTTSDTKGIATIWNETATAIKSAAAAMSGDTHKMVPVLPEMPPPQKKLPVSTGAE